MAARPTTAFSFVVAALLLAGPLASRAGETPVAVQPPISGNVELGLSDELSRFTEVRIGDSPAIIIPGDNVRRTQPFRHFATQVNASVPCGVKGVNCVADLNYDTHTGLRTNDVDTVVAQGDAGVQYGFGKSIYGVKLVKERWTVAGNEFRRIEGVNADWVASLTDQVASYVLVQANRYRHPGDQSTLDSNYRAITGNLRLGTKDAWQSAYTAQATLSREDNVNDDPTLDVKSVLVRLAWDSKPAPGWELGVSGIAQRSSFGAFDPILEVRRIDRYAVADIQLARRLTKDFSIRVDLAYAWYRSTAHAFDNDWASIGTMLIWKF